VLPPEEIGCRPFDERRDGFLISEAAAAVCLESAESESTPRPKPWAVIERFALGGDATHITSSDPSGQTFGHLLGRLELGRGVDLIHAHATGTVLNDPVELAMYEDTCMALETAPIVYSHKGAMGHSLGASGLVSVVLNCMSHRSSAIPGNVRTTRPLANKRVRIPQDVQQRDVRRSAAIAAGFGGAMAGITLVSA
jgi:3-oxoacyl-[acyl-carrier-protein] synthase II